MTLPTQYYIDYKLGTDDVVGDRGTTLSNPWKTIQFALNNISRNAFYGDQLNLKNNAVHEVTTVDFTSYGQGTAIAPVIFKGYQVRANDGGKARVACSTYFNINNLDYLMFIDLDMSGSPSQSLIFGDDGITAVNCTFHNCLRAINGDNDCFIMNCHFYDIHNEALQLTSGFRSTIVNNYFDYTSGDCLQFIDLGISYGGLIANNIFNCGTDDMIALSIIDCYYLVIRNNSFYKSSNATGTAIYFEDAHSLILANNIISTFAYGIQCAGIINNFAVYANNSFYNCGTNVSGSEVLRTLGKEEGNETLTVDPFRNAANNDFRPTNVGNVLGGSYPQFLPVTGKNYLDRGAVQSYKPKRVHLATRF